MMPNQEPHNHSAGSCCHYEPAREPSCHTRPTRWYKNKLLWASAVGLLLYLAGFVFPILEPFQKSMAMYVRMVWWALALGFLLAGVIDRFVPSEYISKVLARPRKRTIVTAAGLGLIMSACSHGILAIAIQLHRKGASGPAVISFLLGSPWANLPVTLLLVSLFHAKGLLIIASALFVSLNTGFLFLLLDRAHWIERNPNTLTVEEDFSIRRHLFDNFRNASWTGRKLLEDAKGILRGAKNLANMILWWLVLGIVLAGLIGAYVPSPIFTHYLGPTFTGLVLTLAAATVIEICSEGSAPLAFEIYRQTGSIGNTFAFLMGGFVTDYTEVGLVWQNLGRRTAFWMVAATVPQVLLLGWIYNLFLKAG